MCLCKGDYGQFSLDTYINMLKQVEKSYHGKYFRFIIPVEDIYNKLCMCNTEMFSTRRWIKKLARKPVNDFFFDLYFTTVHTPRSPFLTNNENLKLKGLSVLNFFVIR